MDKESLILVSPYRPLRTVSRRKKPMTSLNEVSFAQAYYSTGAVPIKSLKVRYDKWPKVKA